MSGLSRSVVKWIQGLDLSYPVKNPKWDFSNGFLVAEIFSWYYPNNINIFSFNNGCSLDAKMSNWALLKKFIISKEINIPAELIDGTIHCKEGAAILLIETIYHLLTNRPVQKALAEHEIDLTDWPYQQQLPLHARSTAARAIKNNIRTTELKTDPNLKYISNKAEYIISDHVSHRKIEREHFPDRFDVKPTLAERCVQRPIPETRKASETFLTEDDVGQEQKISIVDIDSGTFVIDRKSNLEKHYKEIRVNQEAYNINLATLN